MRLKEDSCHSVIQAFQLLFSPSIFIPWLSSRSNLSTIQGTSQYCIPLREICELTNGSCCNLQYMDIPWPILSCMSLLFLECLSGISLLLHSHSLHSSLKLPCELRIRSSNNTFSLSNGHIAMVVESPITLLTSPGGPCVEVANNCRWEDMNNGQSLGLMATTCQFGIS